MGLRKCPRCELNYILVDGELCSVCREQVLGKRPKDEALPFCSICGEFPSLPGEDLCRNCLMEMRQLARPAADNESESGAESDESATREAEPAGESRELGDGLSGHPLDDIADDSDYDL